MYHNVDLWSVISYRSSKKGEGKLSEKEDKIRYYGRYGIMWLVIQFVLCGLDMINIFVFKSNFESSVLFIVLVGCTGALAVYNFQKEEKLKKQI